VFSRQQKVKEIEDIKGERKEVNGDLEDKKGARRREIRRRRGKVTSKKRK
jgi:hypothetical protein